MQHIPDPDSGTDRSEVEITDLDSPTRSGNIVGQPARPYSLSLFFVRIWMSIALIVAVALLFITVLVSLLRQEGPAKIAVPTLPMNFPVSMAVDNGVCYVSSTNGVVTALQTRDGRILWRHAAGTAGQGSITIADGIIYLAPILAGDSTASTITIKALRASDGSALWSRTLSLDSPSSFQLTVANNVVYVQSEAARIDALRASDGSPLWHYVAQVPFVMFPTIASGMVYVSTQDGQLFALRTSDGFPLWIFRFLYPLQGPPVIMDSQIYGVMQKGGMDVLNASTGVLLWHYIPHVPTLGLYPQPLVIHGVVFLLTQDGQLSAHHADNGSTIWQVALHANDILPPVMMEDGDIYIERLNGNIDAIAESSGSIIWHFQNNEVGPELLTVGQGVLYLAYPAANGLYYIGSIIALKAGNGFALWHTTPESASIQLLPAPSDDLILVAFQDGSVRAFQTASGALRWRRVMN